MVKPRICSFPKRGKTEIGKWAVELAGEAGLELDEWQAFVLRESLRTEGDRWVAKEVGLQVARQNGKGAVIEARILAELFLVGSPLTIYSAHNFDTALEHFRRITFLVEETPKLSRELIGRKGSRPYGVTHGKGNEGVELKGNRRLRFRTRTAGGGRGFSCDCLILDEAMFLPEATFGALRPTVRARENPQIWYCGSAVDQQVHEHGVVFARMRERGIAVDPDVAYFDWSVEGDNPGGVPRSVLEDRAAWAQANPALGIRINPESMASELRSMDARTFAVEMLGIGDWPRTDHAAQSPINLELWAELADTRSKVKDPVSLAYDVSPDRRASISAAGKNQHDRWHVEVVDERAGTAWVVPRLVELVKRHKTGGVTCDGYGPAASLIPALEAEGVEVTPLTASEHAQACGRLVDLVEERGLAHLGSDELTDAVKAAATRPLGDAWAWSRKNSTANISPLVSVTLALSAAMTSPRKEFAFGWA